MATAFGPCWDMHTIAVVSIGKTPDFMIEEASFQETNYFKENGGGGFTLEQRVGSPVKERILGQGYFGQRSSPWKEIEIFGGERLDAHGDFLIQSAMLDCHRRDFDLLLIPPFGVKPFSHINKGYPLSHTANMVVGAIYAYWTEFPNLSPSEVVIGVRDDDTYETYADALRDVAGGAMNSDPMLEVKEFQGKLAEFLLSPKYVASGFQQSMRTIHSSLPKSHPARALADFAHARPYFFTAGDIVKLSALAFEDAKFSVYQLSPSYEILRILAASQHPTVKMIANYEKAKLPVFHY